MLSFGNGFACHVVSRRHSQPLTRKSRFVALSLSRSVCAPLALSLSQCVCVCICISSFVSMCASCWLYLLLDLPPSALPLFRSVSAAERCLAPIGRPGLRRADTTLAVSAGAAR